MSCRASLGVGRAADAAWSPSGSLGARNVAPVTSPGRISLAIPWPCPGHALVRACGQRPLARDQMISDRTRRFAKWSAICSFALGMAGQVAYHLMAQAGMARAPWPVTTVVACLPLLVLAMGAALAHMLRAEAAAADA